MTARRHSPRARGFTLIELLVAISILAIVAVLGWRGLDGIIRSRQALTAQMEQTRGMQLAFAQMQSDCENLAPATLLHGRANLLAETDRLTLVRTVLTESEPSRLQVVSYRVRDGVLLRRESSATRDLAQLDMLWQGARSDTDPSPAVTLQSGLNGMTMRLWVNGSWRAAASVTLPAAGQQQVTVPTGQGGEGAQGGQGGQGGAQGGGPNPATTTQVTAPQSNNVPTGLEVSLQAPGLPAALVKIFLLGAV
ncbi:prepilin-type N-terminal cleavage/methylation domain-containing protein [Duganella sp. LX20W]|uniref:Prepilin-type N-terminal cleavage/methylation domain-containing protein n=1 Tax=Rugamonas brunnea TaxID=2758569 RepID=A0A7W2IBH9_9BURK|nr:prepilin-type N-terminal cleavage/methylation domain-containing protein [Rugamonas brunnea]MBA5637228.1 prepilin-type N-terminal cleavage/methylation domain-containing protein [Rugamonas brunnea]